MKKAPARRMNVVVSPDGKKPLSPGGIDPSIWICALSLCRCSGFPAIWDHKAIPLYHNIRLSDACRSTALSILSLLSFCIYFCVNPQLERCCTALNIWLSGNRPHQYRWIYEREGWAMAVDGETLFLKHSFFRYGTIRIQHCIPYIF